MRNGHAGQVTPSEGMGAPTRLQPIQAAFELLFDRLGMRINASTKVLHHV